MGTVGRPGDRRGSSRSGAPQKDTGPGQGSGAADTGAEAAEGFPGPAALPGANSADGVLPDTGLPEEAFRDDGAGAAAVGVDGFPLVGLDFRLRPPADPDPGQDQGRIEALIAADPFADDPQMSSVSWAGPRREATLAEWAAATGTTLDGQAYRPVCAAFPDADEAARIQALHASVPDLPEAPRPQHRSGQGATVPNTPRPTTPRPPAPGQGVLEFPGVAAATGGAAADVHAAADAAPDAVSADSSATAADAGAGAGAADDPGTTAGTSADDDAANSDAAAFPATTAGTAADDDACAAVTGAVAGWSAVAAADALAVLDPAGLGDDDLLDYLHAANRVASFAQGAETAALAVFATRRPPLEDEPADAAGRGHSMWAAGELMALYAISAGTAEHRLEAARTLAETLPATLAAHRDGLLDATRIRAIQRGLENVPGPVASLIEQWFLPGAARMNPAALTRRIRRLAERHNPEPLTVRHERARTQRGLWFTPLPDGMAQLGAVLDAAPARSLYETLEAWARQAQHDGQTSTAATPTGRPSRSLNNLMADCYTDLLHQAFLHPGPGCPCTTGTCTCETTDTGSSAVSGGEPGSSPATGSDRDNVTCNDSGTGDAATTGGDATGTGCSCSCHATSCGGPAGPRGSDRDTNATTGNDSGTRNGSGTGSGAPVRFAPRIPAKINVTIPALTLLGLSEEPATLDGYGPIPPEQARILAGEATSWIRILTDPETGTRLSVGRTSHQPPADLAREVRLRNPVCTGIGCDKPARACELDHTIPFHQRTLAPDGTPQPPGETSITNLLPRSTYCHRLKDHPATGFTVTPHGPGTTMTTTPTGRQYLHTQEPEDPCPF